MYSTQRRCREKAFISVSYSPPSSFPVGVINLQVCNKVISREPLRGHKYVFDVCTSERVYHLNAENAEEKEAWISTLCRLLFGSESSSGAGGGVGGNSAAGAPPLPPHPSDLYVANRYDLCTDMLCGWIDWTILLCTHLSYTSVPTLIRIFVLT